MKKIFLAYAVMATTLTGCIHGSSTTAPTTTSLGLGLSGADGVVTAIAGSDLLGSVTGTSGTVNDLLGGSNPLTDQLDSVATNLQPVGEPVANAVETTVVPLLSGLSDPGLGASGTDSAVTQLLGADVVGTLIGTSGGVLPSIVEGTDGGALGTVLDPVTSALPADVSLAPVTQPVVDLLSGGLPSTGTGSGGSSPLSTVTDLLGGSSPLSSVTDLLGGSATSPLSGGTSSIPVVGSLLSNLPVPGQ